MPISPFLLLYKGHNLGCFHDIDTQTDDIDEFIAGVETATGLPLRNFLDFVGVSAGEIYQKLGPYNHGYHDAATCDRTIMSYPRDGCPESGPGGSILRYSNIAHKYNGITLGDADTANCARAITESAKRARSYKPAKVWKASDPSSRHYSFVVSSSISNKVSAILSDC